MRLAPWLWMCLLLMPMAAAAADVGWEYERRPLTLTLTDGTVLPVDLRVPRGPAGPMPAVMLFAGFEAAGHVLELLPPVAPVVKASFPYPLNVETRGLSWRQRLGQLPAARDAIPRMFEAISLLYAELRAMPEVDAERIVIVGVSLGSPFAVIAGQQHAVPGIAIVHGFADLPVVIENILSRQLSQRLPRLGPWLARRLTRFIVWYAELPRVEDFAADLGAGQSVLVVDAESDRLVPPKAREALHRALEQSGANLRFEQTPGGHVNEDTDELIAKILALLVGWMGERALL